MFDWDWSPGALCVYVCVFGYGSSCKVLEKVSMGHGCPHLLFLFHLQLNIGYTISEQDTIYILSISCSSRA